MKRRKLKQKKTSKTTRKSSIQKMNDKVENKSGNGEDGTSESTALDPPPDTADDDSVKRILKNLPNKFENMSKSIDRFLNQLQSNTHTKPESRDKVQTKTISDNRQKEEDIVRKTTTGIFKLNLNENGWSLDEIDPKTNEIQIIEVDLSESERALFKLPEEYVVNKVAPDGNSFFDSFRQGLVVLGGRIGVTVTYLRAICAHTARTPPSWLAKAIIYAYLSTPAGADLGATPEEFAERTLRQDTWGEIEIHGRILCEHFDVNLYVLAVDDKKNVKRSLVSFEGVSSVDDVPFGRPNTIYMINRRHDNFEPLLPSSSRTHHTNKSNTDPASGNVKDCTIEPATNQKSSEPKPSTSVVNNDDDHRPPAPPAETSRQAVQAQTLTSFSPIQNTSLVLSREFERVQCAVKSGNINELETALAEHHRVLHLSQDEPRLMELSLRDAIRTTDIHILDMVYEHWSSITESAQNHHIYYLKLLGKALVAARDSCKDILIQDSQLGTNVHCIIEFNKFKIELSRELFDFRTTAHSSASDSKTEEDKLKQILGILTTVIDIYDEFCNKNIRMTKRLQIDKVWIQPLLNDHTTMYIRFILYVMYETYYRKLDFFIASVILEHFHSLKLRLELPINCYQEIERALYYFIYRVKEDWRHYLPENRNNNKLKLWIDNLSMYIEIPYDRSRLLNGLVIYLEWEKYKLSVKQLQDELRHPNVMDKLRAKKKNKSATNQAEENTLTLLPSLRDEHSLRKVVKYLEACERTIRTTHGYFAALVVQRVLQVTGEYFKSNNTVHLSSTTSALLHVFVPGSTLKHVQKLRDDFSHLKRKKGEKPNLIRRIYLEETNLDLFFDVAKDLEQLKIAVNEVVHLYELVLRKSLLREGIDLIANREKDLPLSLRQYKEDIIKLLMPTDEFEKLKNENIIINKLYDESLSALGISKQLIREYVWLISNATDLARKYTETETNCIKYIITKMQAFIDCINNELDDIEQNINCWPSRKAKVKVEEIDDVKERWKSIKHLLTYIKEQGNYFQENSEINNLMLQVEQMPTEYMDQNYVIKQMTGSSGGVTIVRKLLDLLKQEANIYCQNNNLTLTQAKTSYNYNGIKTLKELMSENFYITYKEKEYLKSNIGQHRGNEPLLDKVFNSQKITMKEKNTLFRKIEMDDRCKSIVGYLVEGNKRTPSAPQCLAQRAALLKDVIASNDVPHLVEKYHHDECFRMLTESILADISMIYADCKLPCDRLFYDDRRRQLAEFPLRNFFAHGHPLLEVIGQVLDPNDLPAAWYRFARLVVDDEPALAEVASLYEQGVTAEEAQKNWTGPQTPRLNDYFKKTFYEQLTSEKSAKSANQPQPSTAHKSTKKSTASLDKPTITATLADATSTVALAASTAVAAASTAASAAKSASLAAASAATAIASIESLINLPNPPNLFTKE